MNKKLLFIFLFLVSLVFLINFLYKETKNSKNKLILSPTNLKDNSNVESAKDPFSLIDFVDGEIRQVQNNTLSVLLHGESAPSFPYSYKEATITVTSKTQIKFFKKQENKNVTLNQSPPQGENMSLSDFFVKAQAGDSVMVNAYEDVKDKSNFEAKSIFFLKK